ncbi:MAG: hypothetical protein R2838_24710 [Caldilineaceae bacterium]
MLGQRVAQGDVLIRDETIAAIGDLRDVAADTVIDAGGLLVLPGGVDHPCPLQRRLHEHRQRARLRLRLARAAAFGGTTSVIDFSNQEPGATLHEHAGRQARRGRRQSAIDWGVHPVITQPTDATLAEIPLVVDAGSPPSKST